MPHEPKVKLPKYVIATTDGGTLFTAHESTNDPEVARAALVAFPGSVLVKPHETHLPKVKDPKPPK